LLRFLLARLHMDSLCREDNRRDLLRALSALPEDLKSTYDNILGRIDCQGERKARRAKQIIAWIAFAARLLTVSEIQSALAIEPGDQRLEKDALPDIAPLLATCAGIVCVDSESKVIRFVHFTFQKYFMSNLAATKFSWAQTEITRTCLICLLFESVDIGYCWSDSDMDVRLEQNPLLCYAAQYWGSHARGNLEHNKDIQELILKFLGRPRSVASAIQAMLIPDTHFEGYSRVSPHQAPALWLAARLGLMETCKILLEKGYSINELASNGTTALHVAAKYGSGELVRLLLGRGASVQAVAGLDGTALSVAARYGNSAVIEILLEGGADVEAIAQNGRTALIDAASNGHKTAVRILLESGADITARTMPNAWTSLHGAACNDNVAALGLLLGWGANVNWKTSDGETALHIAAERDQDAALALLLENKADIEAQDRHGCTALHIAATFGSNAALRVLLAWQASTMAKNTTGKSPLHLAARNGFCSTVAVLLQNLTDADVRDSDGTSALHDAASAGQSKVVETLLHHGLDVNSATLSGRTPLHGAAVSGHLETVKLLLENGANIKARSKDGLTARTLASIRYRPDLVDQQALGIHVGIMGPASDKSLEHETSIGAMSNAAEAMLELLLKKEREVDKTVVFEPEASSKQLEVKTQPSLTR
jgi:ankyrin repeat protein